MLYVSTDAPGNVSKMFYKSNLETSLQLRLFFFNETCHLVTFLLSYLVSRGACNDYLYTARQIISDACICYGVNG